MQEEQDTVTCAGDEIDAGGLYQIGLDARPTVGRA